MTHASEAGMVGLAPKWVRLDPKLDKSGTFSDQISVYLAHWVKCNEIWSENVWPTLEPNLPSMDLIHINNWPGIWSSNKFCTQGKDCSLLLYCFLLFCGLLHINLASRSVFHYRIWQGKYDYYNTEFDMKKRIRERGFYGGLMNNNLKESRWHNQNVIK